MRFLSCLARFQHLLVFLAFLLMILIVIEPGLAQSPPATSKPRHQPRQPPPAVDQEQFLSYWTTETGWRSELQLRNNQAVQDLTVTPVLRTSEGNETPLAPLTIKPQAVQSLNLGSAILGFAPQYIGTYGSLALRFHSASARNLYAMLMIYNIGHSIAFHIDATSQTLDPHAGGHEGIWWLPKDTTKDYLVLANRGSNALSLQLALYDSTGTEHTQKLSFAPHQTARYSVRTLIQDAGLSGSYGGLKVTADANSGSLDSLQFLFDETSAFSAILKMFGHDPGAKLEERDLDSAAWALRAPMLALSNPDPALAFPIGTTLHPQLFIRNTTSRLLDATLRFNWRSGTSSGKAPGPSLHLAAFETRLIDIGALQRHGVIPLDAPWTSVILTTSGMPDEVVAVAASYDNTLRYGAQTPFSDQLSFQWEGGMWEFDPHHNSLITAGNGGTTPLQAAFTLFYNEGTQRYDLEQTLQPDEQMWIDVGKLIRQHLPDMNGKILPPDLTSGSYQFRDLSDTGIGDLFEGKVIYDTTYGHVTYGCANCCGYSDDTNTFLWYDPLGVPLSSTAAQGVDSWQTCDNAYEDVSGYFASHWTTANNAVATVDVSGTHTGVSVGSTTSTTYGTLRIGSQGLYCPRFQDHPGGGDNVTTPSQHTYPNPPLTGCRVSVPFDGIVNTTTGKRHQAQDSVGTNIQVGTPVYAPEAGTITNFATGNPHDPRPVSQCAGQNSPANFIEIQSDSDGALTRLYHVTILPALATKGTHVTGGQQIGTIDISGCTSAPHTHIQRKVNGRLVNFTVPCDNSHFDDPSTYYDDSDGTWP